MIFRTFCYGEAVCIGDPSSVISQLPTGGIGRVDELHISESFRQPYQLSKYKLVRVY